MAIYALADESSSVGSMTPPTPEKGRRQGSSTGSLASSDAPQDNDFFKKGSVY